MQAVLERAAQTVHAPASASSRCGPAPVRPLAPGVVHQQHGRRSRTVARRTMAPERHGQQGSYQLQGTVELADRLARAWDAEKGRVANTPLAPAQAAGAVSLPTDASPHEYHPSRGWRTQPHHPSRQELWQHIRLEAWKDAAAEPALASFLYSTILSHNSLENTMAFLLSNKLANTSTLLNGVQLMGLFQHAFESDPTIMDAAIADMLAVKDRDPACEKYSQCMLYFKGYQALQCHRVAHWLWKQGRQPMAFALQSRCSELFHVDIHPGAVVGRGVMLDHATGVVIGETAVVGDNVSMLHHVTLGGSGTGRGTRHPTIGHGVLLGAGVSVVGPVFVGEGSKVGAGSVVISDLPSHSVAVGVPARVIKRDIISEPVRDMDQCMDYVLDYEI